MALMRHRLLLLCAPMLTSPGVPRAPAVSHQRLDNSWHTTGYVPGHRAQTLLCEGHSQLGKATPMSQRAAHRRHQALDTYLADEKVEDICQQLVCSKSWLYKWRARYDATNPAWVQERSTRPKHSPTQTPEHVIQAIVSLRVILRQNGTGGGATAIMHGRAQQGREPIPSRRTMYRMLRRDSTEVKAHASRASMLA